MKEIVVQRAMPGGPQFVTFTADEAAVTLSKPTKRKVARCTGKLTNGKDEKGHGILAFSFSDAIAYWVRTKT